MVDNVLIALGELHATCYHYVKTYPGGREQLVKDYPFMDTKTFYDLVADEEMKKMQDQWFGQIFDNAVTLLKNSGEADSELTDKVAKFKSDWRAKATEAATPLKNDFTTIIHGDMWYKNLMLRLDFTCHPLWYIVVVVQDLQFL